MLGALYLADRGCLASEAVREPRLSSDSEVIG